MKYYVVSDVHGFYTQMISALTAAGFFTDQEPHKLIICGDVFDRGNEAPAMQQFVLDLMHEDKVILIRGNHEDLFSSLVNEDKGIGHPHHLSNGTFSSALQLTGFDPTTARINNCDFAKAARETPFYKEILPAMADYYETDNYVFVHGWIPGVYRRRYYHYFSDWRECGLTEWEAARWYNGMVCISSTYEEKTIVCGHYHTSYGHCRIEEKCSEFGPDADFSPYIAPGIIAIDACTAHSGIVNCIVIED